MMKEVLKTISQKPYLSKAAMSKDCGISEGLFEQILMDLQRFGYLKETTLASGDCGGSCTGCALASSCNTESDSNTDKKTNTNRIHFWQITKKGLQFIM
ncbi:MAG TPA: hypothetical protein PK466_14405 [Thermotogota bacterium]|nr:hypothetical protein [Thermotogota bacterium]